MANENKEYNLAAITLVKGHDVYRFAEEIYSKLETLIDKIEKDESIPFERAMGVIEAEKIVQRCKEEFFKEKYGLDIY